MLKKIISFLFIILTVFMLSNSVLAVKVDSSEESTESYSEAQVQTAPSATVTTIKSDSNYEMIFTTNVMIIVIGILLILLAIAILIRLKN